MSEEKQLTAEEKEAILKEFRVDMRDLGAYTPAEIDVYGFLKSELDDEIDKLGAPFSVRCYPTPYIMKLAEQLTELKGFPHLVDANFREIEYKGHIFVVGCNVNDEFGYFKGELYDGKVKNFDHFDTKSRTLELKLKPTEIYKALTGDYDEEEVSDT